MSHLNKDDYERGVLITKKPLVVILSQLKAKPFVVNLKTKKFLCIYTKFLNLWMHWKKPNGKTI